ncbi:tetratricopeptide repeat-containing serine protease family protein [Streptomyces sp. NPDC051956]|uniref:tetratricopeptide repeat-containing serine protease family protein n=1 Tax=Streptomyces sp. NPDC051956 TaxID=3365677 RepID=UPI0037D81A9B
MKTSRATAGRPHGPASEGVMAGAERDRVVGVWAGRKSRGSGYVLAPRLVLTCAHVVGKRKDAQVRGLANIADVPCRVAAVLPGADLALLEAESDLLPHAAPVRFGQAVTLQPQSECQALGFPRVDSRDRQLNLGGFPLTFSPGFEFTADRYALSLTGAEPDPLPDGSPWAGMSGSAVFCGQLLLGVIIEDRPDWGHRRLDAAPVHLLLADALCRDTLARHCGRTPVLEAVELQRLVLPATGPVAPDSLLDLLHPTAEASPFLGRTALLDDFVTWCRPSAPTERERLELRLLTGHGGAGKSRFACELTHRLVANGWAAVHLREHSPSDAYEVLGRVHKPLLVVVDYAESRTDEILMLLDSLSDSSGRSQVRVLLLARAAGDWWHDLPSAGSRYVRSVWTRAREMRLHDLADDVPDPEVAYRAVVTALARRLPEVPGISEGDWSAEAERLTQDDPVRREHQSALMFHMTALSDLLAAHPATALGKADLPVEEQLLLHEHRHWRSAAATRPPVDKAPPSALGEAVAIATLTKAPTVERARQLITAAPDLAAHSDAAAKWLHDLYGQPGEAFWAGLRPDPLGEYHVGLCAQRNPELLNRLLPMLDAPEAEQALMVLCRSAEHPAHQHLKETIARLVGRSGPSVAKAAVRVATQAAAPEPILKGLWDTVRPGTQTDVLVLIAMHNSLPPHSAALLDWSTAVTEVLVGFYRLGVKSSPRKGMKQALPELARTLCNQSARLAMLGGHEGKALQLSEEAVRVGRRAVSRDPEANRLALAESLGNRANRLMSAGRVLDASRAAREAVDLYRKHHQGHPGSDLPGLARALNNYGACLVRRGQDEEAHQVLSEAVRIRRELVRVYGGPFVSELAGSLVNLSSLLVRRGRQVEARPICEEAVVLCRGLADDDPDANLPRLLEALCSLATAQEASGHHAAAGETVSEALDRDARWPGQRSTGHLRAVAFALRLSTEIALVRKKYDSAVEPTVAAVSRLRELAEKDPGIREDLAETLLTYALILMSQTDTTNRHVLIAASASKEAVEIYRDLVKPNPGVRSALATALVAYGSQVGVFSASRAEAEIALTEATRICERLARRDPRRYQRQLQAARLSLAVVRAGDDSPELDSAIDAAQRLAEPET